MSTFGLIAIQETWFNSTISSAEILAFTDYAMCREDRDYSATGKVDGGGLALFIRNGIEFEELTRIDNLTIEYQIIRAKLVSTHFCILNIYFRPGLVTERRKTVRELDVILTAVKIQYPSDELLIIGD